MITLFPLLIVLLLVIVFIINKIIKTIVISTKLKKYLVILYCIILVTSTITLNFLPKNKLINNSGTASPNANMAGSFDFKELAAKGKLNASDGFLEKSSLSFGYKEKVLKIISISKNIILLGERKNIDDGKIEVLNYVTYSSFGDIDITDKIDPASAKLSENELVLEDGQYLKMEMNEFNLDFTAHQFIKDGLYYNGTGRSSLFGVKVIYIKIPKSLQIDDTSDPLQMIN